MIQLTKIQVSPNNINDNDINITEMQLSITSTNLRDENPIFWTADSFITYFMSSSEFSLCYNFGIRKPVGKK